MPSRSSMKRVLESDSPLPPNKKQKEYGDDQNLEPFLADNASIHNSYPAIDQEDTSTDPSIAFTLAGTPRAASEANRLWNYVCPFNCGKRFNRPCRLEIHIRSHTNERPFACSYDDCDKTFPRKDHLERHVASAHSEGRFQCDFEQCEKRFSTGTRLRRHRQTHESKGLFQCRDHPPCNETFRKKDTLQAHIQKEHIGSKPFPCPHVDAITDLPCAHSYNTEANLRRHIGRSHGANRYFCMICTPESVSALDNEGLLSPPKEPMGFPTYVALQAHTKEAHPPTCVHCGMKCATNATLRSHLELVHNPSEEKALFTCSEEGCERSFTRRGNLSVHIQSVHRKQKRFVCGGFDMQQSKTPEIKAWNGKGACGQGFTAKSSLESHIKTQHLHLGANRKELRKRAKAARKGSNIKSEASMLSKLTGMGYESGRDIPCLVQGCAYRFMRYHDLKTHLASMHLLSDAEIEEIMMEREALHGGQFWIGISDENNQRGGYWESDSFNDPQTLGAPVPIQQQSPYLSPYNGAGFLEHEEALLDTEMGIAFSEGVDIRGRLGWDAQLDTDGEVAWNCASEPRHTQAQGDHYGTGFMGPYMEHDISSAM